MEFPNALLSLMKYVVSQQNHLGGPDRLFMIPDQLSGSGCSKLTTSLVYLFVKISNVNISYMPIFLAEKM